MAAAAAPKPEPSAVTETVLAQGYYEFPRRLAPAAAARVLAAVRSIRAFDHRLFLSQAEFDADPRYTGVNPRPGRNVLEGLDDELAFVERDPAIVAAVGDLLGADYQLLDKKVVCGVPSKSVPAWLKARITDNPVNNLGPYVRPQFRDLTYFYGIDFHQDLIDFKGRDADFITLYVYLHPVGPHDAPLYVLEDSHRLGATVFPHALTKAEGGWLYDDGRGGQMLARQKMMVGETGYAALWHPCTLHGTQPDAADNERLSLRYLFAKAPGAIAGIDRINAALDGPTSLADTRIDLDAAGANQVKANSVNRA